MHVEKQFRELEQVEEIRVYNIDLNEVFNDVPPVKKTEKVRFSNVMKHVPSDINVFTPIDDGEDFIVERIGWNLLERMNLNLENVVGRLLSQVSPFYFELFKDVFKEVLENNETKSMRIFYYCSDKIQTLANIHVVYDEGEIYVVSDLKSAIDDTKTPEEQKRKDEENKANLIEYF